MYETVDYNYTNEAFTVTSEETYQSFELLDLTVLKKFSKHYRNGRTLIFTKEQLKPMLLWEDWSTPH